MIKFYSSDFLPSIIQEPDVAIKKDLAWYKLQNQIKRFRASKKKVTIKDEKTGIPKNVYVNDPTLTPKEKIDAISELIREDPNQVDNNLALGVLLNNVNRDIDTKVVKPTSQQMDILSNAYNLLNITPYTPKPGLIDPMELKRNLHKYSSLITMRDDNRYPQKIEGDGSIITLSNPNEGAEEIMKKTSRYYYDPMSNILVDVDVVGELLKKGLAHTTNESGDVQYNNEDFNLIRYYQQNPTFRKYYRTSHFKTAKDFMNTIRADYRTTEGIKINEILNNLENIKDKSNFDIEQNYNIYRETLNTAKQMVNDAKKNESRLKSYKITPESVINWENLISDVERKLSVLPSEQPSFVDTAVQNAQATVEIPPTMQEVIQEDIPVEETEEELLQPGTELAPLSETHPLPEDIEQMLTEDIGEEEEGEDISTENYDDEINRLTEELMSYREEPPGTEGQGMKKKRSKKHKPKKKTTRKPRKTKQTRKTRKTNKLSKPKQIPIPKCIVREMIK